MKQQNYPLNPTLCLEILTVTIPRKDMIMEPPSFSTKLQKNEHVQFWTRSFQSVKEPLFSRKENRGFGIENWKTDVQK